VRNIRKGVVGLNKAATDTAWITHGKKFHLFLFQDSCVIVEVAYLMIPEKWNSSAQR
jgi:hypothetical protein